MQHGSWVEFNNFLKKRDCWRKGPLVAVTVMVEDLFMLIEYVFQGLGFKKKQKHFPYSRQHELPLSCGVGNCQLERMAHRAVSQKLVQANERSRGHTG